MAKIVKKLAAYIIDNWDKLGKLKRWSINRMVGLEIGPYIYKGLSALIKYLKKFTSDILANLASFLGL